jgi:hypothetical protein
VKPFSFIPLFFFFSNTSAQIIVDDEYTSRRNGGNASSVDIHEIINDPRVAIEKGWSLLSYVGKAAVELGKYANDTYVKPAAAQLADPNFRGQVRENVNSYVSSFTQPKVILFLLKCIICD